MLERLLRSRAEAKVLGVVLFTDGLHLRETARRAGISPPEAKRELDALVSLGVLKSAKSGNLSIFSLNERCPFLQELKTLYLKTDGIFEALRGSISKVRGVDYAFIYGSMARGDYSEGSDVDVLVIGESDENELAMAFTELQKKITREINFILWTRKDFSRKIRENGSFFSSVASGKKIWLAGDEGGFEGVVAKASDKRGKAR
ncbi:MAG: nucleotidyltransferase domain-containing protein [Candidatus Micrarchaeota archaeon]